MIWFLLGHAHGRGGAVRATLSIAAALADRGHQVEVVSLVRLRPVPAFPVPATVRLRTLTAPQRVFGAGWRQPGRIGRRLVSMVPRRLPSQLFLPSDKWYRHVSRWTDLQLHRFFRSARDGVILATDPVLTRLMVQLAHPSLVKIAVEHLNLDRRRPSIRPVLKAVYQQLDGLVTLTEADAEAYRTFLEHAVTVTAIPNAIPPILTDPQMPPLPKTVVAAGRLHHQKGFDQLLDCWRVVSRIHPDWKLLIFGAGPERRHLEKLIQRYRLERQVELRGFDPRFTTILAKSSLFVLSSRYEGFPMVLLEAMALGTPVVAFDCPTGPGQLITDGVNGALVPVGEVGSLAAAVITMIEDPDRRHRFADAAGATVNQYRIHGIADQWERLLRHLTQDSLSDSAQATDDL